ncbi:hypothetical protein C1645_758781 [Glomus cerebriforme]|uniref:Uncharacterized protein n=1 Tax=Glomus cerebriforme TaxID=658196 RepID=A0A397TC91_9GLOM|nr:hypothetical protein C1645_758781 [Glomus cerebriforme]
MKLGDGVVYVDYSSKKLVRFFGKAINFTFEENISIIEHLVRKILDITKGNIVISI